MSADEMEIKRIAFFSSVGNAASRSVVITVGLGIPPRVGKKTWRKTTIWVGEQKFVGDAT